MATEFVPGDGFDLRDVIERFEELEDTEERDEDEEAEYKLIEGLLDETRGYGGDQQWRGDWYPLTFIPESEFEDYARELAEDIGAIDRDASWPNNFIDWPAAANALRMDYSSVTVGGVGYLYR